MHLGQHKSSTLHKPSDSQSWLVIYILVLLVILAIIIGLVLYRTTTPSATSQSKYKNTVYTHCSEKPLNRPTRQAFSSLGIEFISPGDLKVLAHQPSTRTHKIIYIPCSYNNSDLDIQGFIRDYSSTVESKILLHSNSAPLISNYSTPLMGVDLRLDGSGKLSRLYIAAVLGCNKLCAKNGLWSVLERVYGRDGATKITPESWVIPAQSVAFRKQISKIPSTGKAFILKKNIQGKQGLLLTNSPETLTRLISNSGGDKYAVVQKYLAHPYLVHGRKLNIRLYILVRVLQDEAPEWWLYRAGKCIYTNRAYTQLAPSTTIKSGSPADIQVLEQHFTSLNLDSNQVYSIDRCPETIDELREYMSVRGEDWLTVWQKIQLGLQKVAVAYNDKLSCPKGIAQAYQLFGADYIINAIDAIDANAAPARTKMQPYLLEFNKGPEMKYKSPQDPELKSGLQTDVLELVLGPEPDTTKWILLNSVNKSKVTKTHPLKK